MPNWLLALAALAAAALMTFGTGCFLVPLVGEGTWASALLQLASAALAVIIALDIAWPWIDDSGS